MEHFEFDYSFHWNNNITGSKNNIYSLPVTFYLKTFWYKKNYIRYENINPPDKNIPDKECF